VPSRCNWEDKCFLRKLKKHRSMYIEKRMKKRNAW
jgi:hypothetical protein